MENVKWVMTYKEARKILRQKGVKVAIAIQGRPDVQIFAEKSDFLRTMNAIATETGYPGPVNYDGKAESFMYSERDKILYVDGGV